MKLTLSHDPDAAPMAQMAAAAASMTPMAPMMDSSMSSSVPAAYCSSYDGCFVSQPTALNVVMNAPSDPAGISDACDLYTSPVPMTGLHTHTHTHPQDVSSGGGTWMPLAAATGMQTTHHHGGAGVGVGVGGGQPYVSDHDPTPVGGVIKPGTGGGQVGPRIVKLLVEFDEKCKHNEWPVSTLIHCYWCCHRFSTPPFGMPMQCRNGRFYVTGCYCSLECAAAHVFASRDSVDECLSRYALINALSNVLGMGQRVRPAPDRVTLAMFGGPLTIDEFRASSQSDAAASASGGGSGGGDFDVGESADDRIRRRFLVNTPPMVTLTQQVEELHDTDVMSEYRYIPLDNERVSRFQEKVRLRRTKPLMNIKDTLDHTMKLRITPGRSTNPAAATASASAATPVK